MTSLLPRQGIRLELDDGGTRLTAPEVGDLALRVNRWKVLEAAGASPLGKDRRGARRDELHHLREMAEPPKDLPRLLVLFERGVDEIGHETGYDLLTHFDALMGDLDQAVRRLQSWGYTDVHVVTDHGFVLLGPSANVQPFVLEKDRVALLSDRWAFVEPGNPVPVASVPFALDKRWSVALPPGLRSFSPPGVFLHGGATLQEVVLPHLRIRQGATPTHRRMRVKARVPQTDIAIRSVKVELIPKAPESTGLFDSTPEPIRVSVYLGTVETPYTKIKTVEIQAGQADPTSVMLFLVEGHIPPAGTLLPVQVVDADTGEAYASDLNVRITRDLN
jgi:hypothetical protein